MDRRAQQVENLLTTGKKKPTGKEKAAHGRGRRKPGAKLEDAAQRVLRPPRNMCTVLDPACGSGNFLYVTLQMLKDLEKEVCVYAAASAWAACCRSVGPWQLYGIEINPYALRSGADDLWIGYLQWIRDNGYGIAAEPILRPTRHVPVQGRDPRPIRSGQSRKNRNGRRWISSSGIRRFWAERRCEPIWATSTWMLCSSFGGNVFGQKRICAAIGLRRGRGG